MSDCSHVWISNNGKGGEPVFKPDFKDGSGAVGMICKCSRPRCDATLWMNEPAWKQHQRRMQLEASQ